LRAATRGFLCVRCLQERASRCTGGAAQRGIGLTCVRSYIRRSTQSRTELANPGSVRPGPQKPVIRWAGDSTGLGRHYRRRPTTAGFLANGPMSTQRGPRTESWTQQSLPRFTRCRTCALFQDSRQGHRTPRRCSGLTEPSPRAEARSPTVLADSNF